MDLEIDLIAAREEKLMNKVQTLYKLPLSAAVDNQYLQVFHAYRQIHKEYSALAVNDLESLKIALFLQWYALTEPNYLSGIGDLDIEAETMTIAVLNRKLEHGALDEELQWMLGYYAIWDYVFDRFTAFKFVSAVIYAGKEPALPKTINRRLMANRGQMGSYWNSLTVFSGE